VSHIFSLKETEDLNSWYSTPKGAAAVRIQWDLMVRLLRPMRGERLLDVGCGPGFHLSLFKELGLSVSGVDPSWSGLNIAKERLGHAAELRHGFAEDLPFSDNEFDIVSLITTLEFVDDPFKALAEAARVARSRVLVGCLNSLSLTALYRRMRGLIFSDVYSGARFFNPYELKGLMRQILGDTKTVWSTTGVLPLSLMPHTEGVEASPFMQRTPLGAFIAMVTETTPKFMGAARPAKAESFTRPEPAQRSRTNRVFRRARPAVPPILDTFADPRRNHREAAS
jgi:SAM-dependent methyltransferase